MKETTAYYVLGLITGFVLCAFAVWAILIGTVK